MMEMVAKYKDSLPYEAETPVKTYSMDMTTPVVSVIIPAHNAEKHIEQTIKSVQNQTFVDWELIVIDDCSTDSTISKVEHMAAEDPRIKLIKNNKNMGVARSRNKGLDISLGKYVALLDSDDVWYPEKLSKQLEVAEKSAAGIVYCSYEIIDENGNKKHPDYIVPSQTCYDDMLIEVVIAPSSALLCRDIVDHYRFQANEDLEDYIYWLDILRDKYTAVGISEIYVAYRVHSGSRSSNKVFAAFNRWKVYRYNLKLPVFKSIKLFTMYALRALKKYQ